MTKTPKECGATYTGNMVTGFTKAGFSKIKFSINLVLLKGDILLNEKNHTALYIGDGRVVNASSSETGGKYGKDGDQTGREIRVQDYYIYSKGWDCVLRTGNKALIDLACQKAVDIATDDTHGYSQDANKRWGTPDYDCSSLVIDVYSQAMEELDNPASVVPVKEGGMAIDKVVYTVAKGDTLSKIAKKYETTVKAISDLNGIDNPNLIRVGQKLTINVLADKKGAPAPNTKYRVTSKSGLSVRKGPSTSYGIIACYSYDATIQVVSIQNGWAKLNNGSYVSAQYIEEV